MAETVKELSIAAKAALDVLAEADKPLTLGEISEKAGMDIKSGNLTGLVRSGKIVSEEREFVCPECGHKKKYHVFSLAD